MRATSSTRRPIRRELLLLLLRLLGGFHVLLKLVLQGVLLLVLVLQIALLLELVQMQALLQLMLMLLLWQGVVVIRRGQSGHAESTHHGGVRRKHPNRPRKWV